MPTDNKHIPWLTVHTDSFSWNRTVLKIFLPDLVLFRPILNEFTNYFLQHWTFSNLGRHPIKKYKKKWKSVFPKYYYVQSFRSQEKNKRNPVATVVTFWLLYREICITAVSDLLIFSSSWINCYSLWYNAIILQRCFMFFIRLCSTI